MAPKLPPPLAIHSASASAGKAAARAGLPREVPREPPKAPPLPADKPRDTKTRFDADEAGPLPRLLGRHVLLRRIAKGGMGEVYLGSTIGIEGAERPVIVKVIRREHATDPSFVARFLDEARVQAQLQHSGVAQVVEAATDETNGEPYSVVEYVEGRSLGEIRARALSVGYSLNWAEGVSVVQLIAEGLAHVHERKDAAGRGLQIVHRDLSPQNVMVSYAGEAKVIDFGTARGQNRRCHTVTGVVFAKPGYVAPEVANGDSGDARVDLYALGVMAWELCAGRRFLEGDASEHLARVSKNERSLPPIAAECGAPPELDAVLAKLTAFDRDARYLASRTAATDLARILASAPTLPSAERGVRARVAHMMQRLFPGEPLRSRKEFGELVEHARATGVLPGKQPKRPTAPAAPALPSRPAPAPPPSDPSLVPGTRYRKVREIGRGATSVVYEAEHKDLGRTVALKVLDTTGLSSGDKKALVERFREEARVLSKLESPFLVRVFDFGEADDGRPFSAMELLRGETLEAHLAREDGMPWREALAHARSVLLGLEVAHAAGLVHGDLKPANLFLADSCLKILDFGLAAELQKKGEVRISGTPEYMAPEQFGGGEVDARADLYALGCVLYEMLSGRLPFVADGAVGILDAKTKGSPERLRDRAPARRIPPATDALVMRALARHPSVRFASAAEMRAEVERLLGAPERLRKSRRTLGFAALAVTLTLGSFLVARTAPVRGALARLGASPAPVELAQAKLEVLSEPESVAPPPTDLAALMDSDEGDGDGLEGAELPRPIEPKPELKRMKKKASPTEVAAEKRRAADPVEEDEPDLKVTLELGGDDAEVAAQKGSEKKAGKPSQKKPTKTADAKKSKKKPAKKGEPKGEPKKPDPKKPEPKK